MKYLWVSICWQRRTRQNNLWVEEPQSSFMDVDESTWRWRVCFSAHIFNLNECRSEQPAGRSHMPPLLPGLLQTIVVTSPLWKECVCVFTPKHAGFTQSPMMNRSNQFGCINVAFNANTTCRLPSQTARVSDEADFSESFRNAKNSAASTVTRLRISLLQRRKKS